MRIMTRSWRRRRRSRVIQPSCFRPSSLPKKPPPAPLLPSFPSSCLAGRLMKLKVVQVSSLLCHMNCVPRPVSCILCPAYCVPSCVTHVLSPVVPIVFPLSCALCPPTCVLQPVSYTLYPPHVSLVPFHVSSVLSPSTFVLLPFSSTCVPRPLFSSLYPTFFSNIICVSSQFIYFVQFFEL